MQCASGEKVVELTRRGERRERALAELRGRYETFEMVVAALAAMIAASPSTGAEPRCTPSQVKLHSIRELVGGRVRMVDVIRRVYECSPLCEGRYTRDEILDEPLRRICGLPDFLEDYRYERADWLGVPVDDEDDEDEDDVKGGFARTGGGYGAHDRDPGTTKGSQTRRYKAVYGQKAVRAASARRDKASPAPPKSQRATATEKGRAKR